MLACRKYGLILSSLGQNEQAVSILQRTLQRRKDILGARHYKTLHCMVGHLQQHPAGHCQVIAIQHHTVPMHDMYSACIL